MVIGELPPEQNGGTHLQTRPYFQGSLLPLWGIKGSGAQVVLSSILPVTGRDFGRNRCAQDINTWLQDWCICQGFGFYNHGRVFKTQGMPGPDGVHLSPEENVSLLVSWQD